MTLPSQLFAVLRVDWFHFDRDERLSEALTPEAVSQYVTVKVVLDDLEEAEAEVVRLNALQADREVESFYFVLPTRSSSRDTSAE